MEQALGAFSLNFLGNAINQMMSEGSNRRLQENQARLNYQYAEKYARNNATWNRAGLESAGFNPMLAVQNATSGANSSWASGAHADSPITDYGTSTIANAQSVKRLDNETKIAESTVKANEATAENQLADAANKRAENPFLPDKMKSEIKKLDSDTAYTQALKQNLKDRLELDQYLGESGLAVQRRGQDLIYNASTYASNVAKYGYQVNERNNIRTNHTERGRTRAGGASFFLDKYKDYP